MAIQPGFCFGGYGSGLVDPVPTHPVVHRSCGQQNIARAHSQTESLEGPANQACPCIRPTRHVSYDMRQHATFQTYILR